MVVAKVADLEAERPDDAGGSVAELGRIPAPRRRLVEGFLHSWRLSVRRNAARKSLADGEDGQSPRSDQQAAGRRFKARGGEPELIGGRSLGLAAKEDTEDEGAGAVPRRAGLGGWSSAEDRTFFLMQ